MDFTNQLQFKIIGGASCMCRDIAEVDVFLEREANYSMQKVEYDALDTFLCSVLPEREFKPEEKRRFAIFDMGDGTWKEFPYDAELPEGAHELAKIYSSAFIPVNVPIAVFTLNASGNPISVRISRKSSTDSQPLSFIEECWMQQVSSFSDKSVPKVKVDLSPLKPQEYDLPAEGQEYTLKCGEMSYIVNKPADMLFALKSILLHPVSYELKNLVYELFNHLNNFPRNVAFSMPMPFYCDERKVIYVGGNGLNDKRKLAYVGQIYTQFFSGLPGNVFQLRLNEFEAAPLSVLFVRNGSRKIPMR